ncbi:MAG: hypothetical protein Q8M66_09345 [Actinomycetota bacterium]|nr:hypothetical protein [Actinomycetota bacterium]
MKEKFYETMKALRYVAQHGKTKVSRSMSDFVSDKFVQLSNEPTMLSFFDKFCQIMDTSIDAMHPEQRREMIGAITCPESVSVLNWIRKYPKVAGLLTTIGKWEDQKDACDAITVEPYDKKSGNATPQPKFDIGVKLTTLSPLAHGGDTKAGNATLFRRMQVMTDGGVVSLPYYAGNAFRGQLRDILADHFLKTIGISTRRDKPKVALWFFHAIYAGGALEEKSKSGEALAKLMGDNGAVKADGVYLFRDTLPALSLFGCALGNRILNGRFKASDFRPACVEWSNGQSSVNELFEWCFLTRREDHEGHDDDKNSSMIANTECIKQGVVLTGGIDTDQHISELELSALGRGLMLMQKKGYIGANSNRGFGKVAVEIENCPSPELYDNYLSDNKESIIAFLEKLGAYGQTVNAE